MPKNRWLAIGISIVFTVQIHLGSAQRNEAFRSFLRIDVCDVEDRVYLKGGFFPEGGIEDWTLEAEECEFLKTESVWEGALMELPVVPGYDHKVRIKVMPLEECHFAFYLTDPGLPNEYYARLAGKKRAPLVKTVHNSAKATKVVEFDLDSDLLAGRESVMMFYRPMKIENPEEKALVEFRTYEAELLVKAGNELDRILDLYRALDEQRHRKERFTLLADSIVRPGEEFSLFIVAWTKAGFPDLNYEGTLRLVSNAPGLVVPATITFDPCDKGVKRLHDLQCKRDGTYLLRAFQEGDPAETCRSNYILCDSKAEYKIFWGDLHIHTSLSDGSYSLDSTYQFARDVAKLDFVSMNDHDLWRWKEKWELNQAKAKEYNIPGEFVAIQGTEWTSVVRGHHNVWFPTDDVPEFYRADPEEFYSQSVAQLWESVRPYGGIMCTHHLHPNNDYSDWSLEREPVVEVYSQWGSSETSGQPEQTIIQYNHQRIQEARSSNSAVDLLNRGLKLGFVAGSDTHVSTPGANVSGIYRVGVSPHRRPGITAVYAKELTREGILDAIRNRRCFGTMNERIIIDFSINGHMMGEEFELENTPAKIRMRAWGTGKIASISLIRNGEVIYCPLHWGSRDYVDLEFVDAKLPEGTSYYYLRVQQLLHGEYVNAWSSPIWVRYPPQRESGQ